jgi:hypothetical protein
MLVLQMPLISGNFPAADELCLLPCTGYKALVEVEGDLVVRSAGLTRRAPLGGIGPDACLCRNAHTLHAVLLPVSGLPLPPAGVAGDGLVPHVPVSLMLRVCCAVSRILNHYVGPNVSACALPSM